MSAGGSGAAPPSAPAILVAPVFSHGPGVLPGPGCGAMTGPAPLERAEALAIIREELERGGVVTTELGLEWPDVIIPQRRALGSGGNVTLEEIPGLERPLLVDGHDPRTGVAFVFVGWERFQELGGSSEVQQPDLPAVARYVGYKVRAQRRAPGALLLFYDPMPDSTPAGDARRLLGQQVRDALAWLKKQPRVALAPIETAPTPRSRPRSRLQDAAPPPVPRARWRRVDSDVWLWVALHHPWPRADWEDWAADELELGVTSTADGGGVPVPPDQPWVVAVPGCDARDAERLMTGLTAEVKRRGFAGLDLRPCRELTARSLRHLASLGSLRTLALPAATCSLEAMRHLAGLTQLRHLDLAGVAIGDAELHALRGLVRLESLDLSRTKISDAGLAHLASMRALRRLLLRGTAVSDDGMRRVAALPLEELDLRGTEVSGRGLPALATARSLRRLAVPTRDVTSVGLKPLAALPRLEALTLGGSIIDRDLRDLRDLGALRSLDLAATSVGDDGLAHLSALTGLRALRLSPHVTDGGLPRLHHLRSLTAITLPDSITYRGLGFLDGMPGLRRLDMPRGTTDAELALVPRIAPRLRRLDLSKAGRITDAGLSSLRRLAQLEELRLAVDCTGCVPGTAPCGDPALGTADPTDCEGCGGRWRGITGGGLAHLGGLLALRRVTLQRIGVVAGGLEHLAKLPHLEELDLAWSRVTDGALAPLARAVTLRKLSLAHTPVGDRGLATLASHRALRRLDLDGTPVTDDGVRLLANLPALTELSLFQSRAHGIAFDALARGPMVTARVPTTVDHAFGNLSNNCMSAEGLFALQRLRNARAAARTKAGRPKILP
ncbi:MAG TPA: hypothetical protein VGQ83_31385 [Polyangia bacterium]